MRHRLILTLSMLALVGGGVTATGWLAVQHTRQVVIPIELARLQEQANQLARTLTLDLQTLREDLAGMSHMASLQDYTFAIAASAVVHPPSRVDLDRRVHHLFRSQLESKKHYLQFRLVALGADERDHVRVERQSPEPLPHGLSGELLASHIPREQLQAAANLRADEILILTADFAQANHHDRSPGPSVAYLVCPLALAGAPAHALLILAVDFHAILSSLRRDASNDADLYLVDTVGRFLFQPDHTHPTARSLAERAHLSREFSELHVQTSGITSNAILLPDEPPRIAAWAPISLTHAPRLTLVQINDATGLHLGLAAIWEANLVAGSLIALCSLMASYFTARIFTQPIADLVGQAQSRHTGNPFRGQRFIITEISDLAQALSAMMTRNEQASLALENEIQEREIVQVRLARQLDRERLYAAVDQSDDAIMTLDPLGRVTSWNPGAERIFGYTAQEMIGQSLDNLIPPEERSTAQLSFAAAVAGQKPAQYKATRRRRDGLTREMAISLAPLHAENGGLIGIAKVARDITEERLLHQRFDLAVQASPNGMIMCNVSGSIVLANHAAERIFGYEPGGLLGEQLDRLVPTAVDHDQLRRPGDAKSDRVAETLGDGRDLLAKRRDGSEFPVEIGLNPIPTSQGTLILGVIVDITHRKQTEAALETQRRRLARYHADLEQFAYIASHDLQEPLRMVASYAELLKQRYSQFLDAKGLNYLGYCLEGARRMHQLLAEILSYSHLESMTPLRESFDCQTLVAEAIDVLADTIAHTGAKIDVGKLPVIFAERSRIFQLFLHLIGNAIKFWRENPPKVVVRAELQADAWVFSVRDNGIGIDKAHEQKVFLMFQRLHAREDFAGSGIGLALCKRIVEQHGGSLWFESEVGTGTTFYFRIPREKPFTS